MEIKEIRSFVLLAQNLHFGKTAEFLNITQPALTKQIARLETSLGSLLFVRGRHGCKLTTFGKQFFQEAKQFISHYERLCMLGKEIAHGNTGMLRIGFGLYTLELVPALIVQIRHTTPGIEVQLKDLSTTGQLHALENEELDIGFLKLPVPKQFETIPLQQDQLVLITNHADSDFSIQNCSNRPFVILSKERSLTLYNQVLLVCANQGFFPNIVQEVPEINTIIALVKAGLGVSILPKSFCETHLPDIHIHPLNDLEASWCIGAAWRKNDSNPALIRFIALLKQAIA